MIFGVYESFQHWNAGLREPRIMVSHTISRTIGSAASFGTYLGVYSGTKCSMAVARGGKQDLLNTATAGGLAGALSVLRSGDPRAMAGSAFMGAAIMCVVEGSDGGGGGGTRGGGDGGGGAPPSVQK